MTRSSTTDGPAGETGRQHVTATEIEQRWLNEPDFGIGEAMVRKLWDEYFRLTYDEWERVNAVDFKYISLPKPNPDAHLGAEDA